MEFPVEWRACKVCEFSEVKGGKRLPKGHDFSEEKTRFPYLRVSDFNNGSISVDSLRYLTEDSLRQISTYTISKDDVYISIAGTIGAVGFVPDSLDGANLTENAAKICDIKAINKNYLRYHLQSDSAQSVFQEKAVSTTQPKLALFKIRDLEIPLPPLAEQKQIAAKLDELLAQVDTIKTRLDAIPHILKRFRQSVLAAAVSGRLTEEWKKTAKAPSWVEKKIDEVVRVVNGKAFPSDDYSDQGVRLLRPGNLHASGQVVWNSKNTIYIPNEWTGRRPELILKPGALLMNLTAQSLKDEFLGRVCILGKSDEIILLNQRICSFEPKEQNIFFIKFLYIFFKSPIFREYVDTLDTGTLIKHLNVKDVLSFKVMLPSPDEQTEIVRRVEQLFAYADQIEQRVKDAQSRVNHLTQSILAKAFRGELTADWRAQNPDLISGENSAEALLTRIRTEREQKAVTAKRGKANKKQRHLHNES